MLARTTTSSELTDETLAERVQQQDVAAFTLLYERYAQSIYVLAAHLLTPRDAEEVVQEVFLRLWQRAAQFDPQRGSFRSWFTTLSRHYIFDQLKRGNRELRRAALDEIDRLLAETVDPTPQPLEMIWTHDRQQAMTQALHDLPPEQRRAIVLAYFGGLSQAQIAQELGWPLGTVKKRIALGLQKLRTYLVQWQETA